MSLLRKASLLVASLAALFLVACAGQAATPTPSPPSPTPTPLPPGVTPIPPTPIPTPLPPGVPSRPPTPTPQLAPAGTPSSIKAPTPSVPPYDYSDYDVLTPGPYPSPTDSPTPPAPLPPLPTPTPSPIPTSGQASVTISGFAFSPSNLTISRGTKVTWTNRDGFPHTVTSTSLPVSFDSGSLDQNPSFSITFSQAGTYNYICSIHPSMTASVVVQ